MTVQPRILPLAVADRKRRMGQTELPAIDDNRRPQPVPQLPIECGTLPCGGDEAESRVTTGGILAARDDAVEPLRIGAADGIMPIGGAV